MQGLQLWSAAVGKCFEENPSAQMFIELMLSECWFATLLRGLQVEKMQRFHHWYGVNLKMKMSHMVDYSQLVLMDLSQSGICELFNLR
jgi:hypothetical protein